MDKENEAEQKRSGHKSPLPNKEIIALCLFMRDVLFSNYQILFRHAQVDTEMGEHILMSGSNEQ